MVERHGTGIEWRAKAKGVRRGGGMKVRTGSRPDRQITKQKQTTEGRGGEGGKMRWKLEKKKANGNGDCGWE